MADALASLPPGLIADVFAGRLSPAQIAARHRLPPDALSQALALLGEAGLAPPAPKPGGAPAFLPGPNEFVSDKKDGSDFHWRDAARLVTEMQAVSGKASWSQDTAVIDFSHRTTPVLVAPIGDWQIGSYGTDYHLLEEFTDLLLSRDDLFIALVGDICQFAIKMRGVLEVMDNALTPKMQMRFLESWFHEIAPRVLWYTWSNHETERFENAVGFDAPAELVNRRVVYFNHIGHVDLLVGGETYKIATSHFFKGKATETNPFNGLMKYLRLTAPGREIAVAGDTHRPGQAQYVEGGAVKTVVNCGSIQTMSGYAKRYFTLDTVPAYPCFALHPDRHAISPFWSIPQMLEAYPAP